MKSLLVMLASAMVVFHLSLDCAPGDAGKPAEMTAIECGHDHDDHSSHGCHGDACQTVLMAKVACDAPTVALAVLPLFTAAEQPCVEALADLDTGGLTASGSRHVLCCRFLI